MPFWQKCFAVYDFHLTILFLVTICNNLAYIFLIYSLHDEQNAIKRLISKRLGENHFQGKYLIGSERYQMQYGLTQHYCQQQYANANNFAHPVRVASSRLISYHPIEIRYAFKRVGFEQQPDNITWNELSYHLAHKYILHSIYTLVFIHFCS